ncbi:MAG: phosphoglycerate dehydrogenase [Lachnospiraceae bacterium]|nr:phosphoglycerate dehydrogenase [Lachnospiraceae bacterium]
MKDRKIYCLNNISPVGTSLFREGYTLIDTPNEAAGILVRSADMKEMQFPAELRAIARAGAGVNNIPIDRCSEEGIVVFNTPGANANAVKELVIAGLVLSARDVVGGADWVRANAEDENIKKDAEKAKKAFAGNEIKGKTLGVIGLGAIGAQVANTALDLGMTVYGYDPFLSVDAAWSLSREVRYAASLDDLFAVSDFLTIHVPYMESTKHTINRETIAKMKDGVRFLNFARDALVDDEAMAEALESGKVRVYVTDFPNPAVVKMKNTVIFPHLGASTEEAEDNCAVMAVKQLQDYLDNGNIKNSVNFPALNAGTCQTEARVAILHRNIPNMLSQITAFFGQNGLNIENLASKSRGSYEYTLLDISAPMPHDTVEKLKAIDGVLRVRRLAPKN